MRGYAVLGFEKALEVSCIAEAVVLGDFLYGIRGSAQAADDVCQPQFGDTVVHAAFEKLPESDFQQSARDADGIYDITDGKGL